MTLKHIDFFDSPVMRELGRQAVKNGTVIEEIVKTAAEHKAPVYAPTGDLFKDLVLLASGLRDKGFTKEAQALEAKIVAYKRAEKEFSSELTNAHPDGDVEMGEASNGLGDVETLESAHKKIVDVVTKQPTGKQAQLLAAVEDILKKAQAGDSFEQFMGAAPANLGGAVDSRTRRIQHINQLLATKDSELSSAFKSVKGAIAALGFDGSKVTVENQPYLNLYAAKAGIAPDAIVGLFDLWNFVYGKGVNADPRVILNKMLAMDGPSLRAYLDKVEPGLFDRYFPKPAEPLQTGLDKAVDAVKEIGKGVLGIAGFEAMFDAFKKSDQIKAVAVELNNKMVAKYNAVLGMDKLKAATAALQADLAKSVERLDITHKQLLAIAPLDEKTTTTNSTLLTQLNVVKDSFSSFLNEQAKSRELYEAAEVLMGKNLVVQPLVLIEGALSDLISKVAGLPLTESDKIVPEATLSTLAETFASSALGLKGYTEQMVPKGSKQYNDYVEDIKLLWSVGNVLKSGGIKSYVAIYDDLQTLLPNATSLAKLQQLASGYAGAVNKLTATMAERTGTTTVETPTNASDNSETLEKFSQRLNPGVVPAVVKGPVATVPAKGPPGTGGNIGLAKANMNDPNEAATAYMQQHLAYFAEALSKETSKSKFTNYNPNDITTIVRTGPKANPAVNTYDGKWGPQTQGALEVAKKYLDQLGLTGLETQARYNAQSRSFAADTEAVSKKNAELLKQASQLLGAGGQAGTTDAPVRYGRMNGIYIFDTDLASLQAFYKFCVKNGWLKEETRVNEGGGKPDTGVLLQEFVMLLDAVISNAKELYSKASAVSAKYYQDAINRWRELVDLVHRFSWPTTDETFLMPYDTLPSAPTGVAGGVGGMQTKLPGQKPAGGMYEGGVDEGGDWGAGPAHKVGYPIDPGTFNIDLNSGWYSGFVRTTGAPTTLLGYNMFSSYPGTQLMYSFFPGAPDAKKKYYELLNYLNKAIAEAIKKWMLDPRIKPNQDARAKMMEMGAAWREIILGQIQDLGFQVG